ncbi:hypothetical protein CAEBREN_24738 [Caenorhabditis brenneri]|uniref:Uncharacterized protein n=1 Tax=Caenorhabditis brenneri TaxID=135651 RepID=G0N038_CAEBE|nr:hypothetical protein CAEBREN_24738 [Caenorhabditis brenneri]
MSMQKLDTPGCGPTLVGSQRGRLGSRSIVASAREQWIQYDWFVCILRRAAGMEMDTPGCGAVTEWVKACGASVLQVSLSRFAY